MNEMTEKEPNERVSMNKGLMDMNYIIIKNLITIKKFGYNPLSIYLFII
jgi:hypothetical protein